MKDDDCPYADFREQRVLFGDLVRKLVGSRHLPTFLAVEFNITLARAKALGRGHEYFLLEALGRWRDDPPESRPREAARIAEVIANVSRGLAASALDDDAREQDAAFLAALTSFREGVWVRGEVSAIETRDSWAFDRHLEGLTPNAIRRRFPSQGLEDKTEAAVRKGLKREAKRRGVEYVPNRQGRPPKKN